MPSCEVFIYPYICPKHYSVSTEKFNYYLKFFKNKKILQEHTKTKEHPIYQEKRHFIDFINIVKEEMHSLYGIQDFHDSEICTYEMAKNGYLFSHRLAEETEITNPNKKSNYRGVFNVAIYL